MMKKVLGVVLALSLTVTGAVTTGSMNVKAAGPVVTALAASNTADTAEVIENNTTKAGAVEWEEDTVERWYKFTNPYKTDSVAVVTFTATMACHPAYKVYDSTFADPDVCQEGYFHQDQPDTVHVGLKAGETKYVKVLNNYKASWNVSLSITPEEVNTIKAAKKTVKSGTTINARMDYVGDVDVYKIKAKKAGKMVISVTDKSIRGNTADWIGVSFKVYNKAKKSKKGETEVSIGQTRSKSIKVKKGEWVYVEVKGNGVDLEEHLGEYSVSTKIKK